MLRMKNCDRHDTADILQNFNTKQNARMTVAATVCWFSISFKGYLISCLKISMVSLSLAWPPNSFLFLIRYFFICLVFIAFIFLSSLMIVTLYYCTHTCIYYSLCCSFFLRRSTTPYTVFVHHLIC